MSSIVLQASSGLTTAAWHGIDWAGCSRRVRSLQRRIVQAVQRVHQSTQLHHRVLHGALVMLERSAVKVARCVLRGERSREAPDLPGGDGRERRTGPEMKGDVMAENVDELIEKVRATDVAGRRELGKTLLAGIQGQELNEVVAGILSNLPKDNLKSCAVEAVKQLPDEEKKAAVEETAAQLSKPQQDEVAQALRGMPPPAEPTRNALWLVVVSGFSVVLVGTFLTIAIGMFKAPAEGAVTKPELVLTMFTSVVGFLAGLFVPSPTGNRQG